MPDEPLSLLFLDPVGIPPYSSRGLTMQLQPIDDQANFRRTVNGKLVNISPAQFQLYHAIINGNDQDPPAWDGVWTGTELIVDSIAELAYKIGGSQQRPSVDSNYRSDGQFIFYRPRLYMTVTVMTITRDEWGAMVTWSMELEETEPPGD